MPGNHRAGCTALRRSRERCRWLHLGRHAASQRIECACELRTVKRDGGRTPPAGVLALLVEDGILVIEAVERLGKAERVLRDDGELEGPHRLFDDFVQPR